MSPAGKGSGPCREVAGLLARSAEDAFCGLRQLETFPQPQEGLFLEPRRSLETGSGRSRGLERSVLECGLALNGLARVGTTGRGNPIKPAGRPLPRSNLSSQLC